MPHADPVNWQPISEMPLIASMIDGALDDTRDHIETLTKARTRPHVLDDATIDRVERVHNEQLEFVDIYAQQIRRWRIERPTSDQTRELDRMEEQNRQLRAVTANVLSLVHELRQGTINRIIETSDVELGLRALLGNSPITRR
jgi:nitrogen-specific signal transduction histidine kinase